MSVSGIMTSLRTSNDEVFNKTRYSGLLLKQKEMDNLPRNAPTFLVHNTL